MNFFKMFALSILIYVLIVFFSLLSEITQKKKKPKDAFLGIKSIMLKSFLYFLVLIIASYVYFVVLGKS
jgi:hypothetical protein